MVLNSLDHKVILITGGLGMLGRSAISMFLQRGATVFACDHKSAEGMADIEQLQEQYGEQRFRFMQADVCDEGMVQQLVSEVDRSYHRLDGMYHTVYTSKWKPITELPLSEWEDTIRGTLTSAFLVCKHVLPLMIRSGGGSIVNTSSILGEVVQPGCHAYGAGKAGLNHFTRVMAADYAKHGIRANVLVPGDFRSDEAMARKSEQEKESTRQCVWLGRSARADEINEMASFLLSDASSYVTGALLHVDGGFHL